MESKVEEKVKYFINNNSTELGYYDFSMQINEFEELLRVMLNYSQSPYRNSFKLYGINNKFFKIFHDGSCFGYYIKKQEINKIGNFYQSKITQQQIYNDDFAGLKTYWVEESYEEIVFKLDEQMSLIFSKQTDIPRQVVEYSVFLEPKNISVDINRYVKAIENIISERISLSNICETMQ